MNLQKLILLTLFLPLTLTSQQRNLNIGEWESLLPYKRGISVTQSQKNIIYATPYSIFTIDKSDLSHEVFSKTNGLSDTGVEFVRYDEYNQQLFIIYQNNNIDIIKQGDIYNVPDIKINQSIIGNKQINDIYIPTQSTMYLATSFGIVEFRTDKLEFASTIFTSKEVKSITKAGDYLFAMFEDEIYSINTSIGVNIADFSNWIKLPFSHTSSLVSISTIDDKLFLFDKTTAYILLDDFTFEALTAFIDPQYEIVFARASNSQVLVGAVNPNNDKGRLYKIDTDGDVTEGTTGCNNQISDAIIDDQDRYWFGDLYRDIRYTEGFGGNCKKIDLPSFLTAEVSDIAVRDGDVFIASGGAKDNYALSSTRSGLFSRQSARFINYNEYTLDIIREADFANVFQVEVDPVSDKVYLGSYYNGIIQLDTETNEAVHFATENSGLQHPKGESDGERISGLAFDSNGTLWSNNIYAPNPLVAYANDGSWYNYSTPTDGNIAKVKVDKEDILWNIITGPKGGLLLYDTNGTLEDPSDDNQRIISKDNSAITTGFINCIAIDNTGDVWVGTDEGPIVFTGGRSIFEDENPGSRLKVDLDGNVNFLLSDEDIRCIAVDGGNRKWIGTRNGLFLMSPNGQEQIEHYTVDNSPLFANTIIDLAFSDDGIMYVGTDKGVQSIKTATTKGSQRHNPSEVYAFPNPVRPEYTDDIYIRGLANNSTVKITDINGNLVKEVESLGGQASWDGTNLNGNKVSSGVYLVFSTGKVNFETSDSFVTKIMIIR